MELTNARFVEISIEKLTNYRQSIRLLEGEQNLSNETRIIAIQEMLNAISVELDVEAPTLVVHGELSREQGRSTLSYLNCADNKIVIIGKASVITLLHLYYRFLRNIGLDIADSFELVHQIHSTVYADMWAAGRFIKRDGLIVAIPKDQAVPVSTIQEEQVIEEVNNIVQETPVEVVPPVVEAVPEPFPVEDEDEPEDEVESVESWKLMVVENGQYKKAKCPTCGTLVTPLFKYNNNGVVITRMNGRSVYTAQHTDCDTTWNVRIS